VSWFGDWRKRTPTVCGSLWARAILLTSAAAGIAIGIEHHLGRQIWLWLRTGNFVSSVRGENAAASGALGQYRTAECELGA
jgi:hypothetical protein